MDDIELIPDLVIDENEEFQFHEVKKQIADTSGAIIEEDKEKRVPVTILTGYLGSGKSTLLEQIAKRGDRKLAVILNEFGDSIDIEKSLTVKDKNENEIEEWLDLGNGCLCCTVKDNGVAAIERLVAKKKGFDHIILETTGLADPGPITTMFWLDDGLLSNVYIDGVITVLDSKNIEKCLDDIEDKDEEHIHHHEHKEGNLDKDNHYNEQLTVAHVQIALADVILLNKIDTVNNEEIKRIENRVKSINSNVPIYETKFGDISLDKILDLHAYEATDVNELVRTKNTESNVHDHRMGTKTFDFKKLSSLDEFNNFEKFLQDLLWDDVIENRNENQINKSNNDKEMEIHRVKGLIFINDSYKVIQGVRKTYDVIDGVQDINEIELKCSRLVIIGKYIDSELIKKSFKNHMKFEIL
ncbi:hypothetical protein DAPK24_013810 [Pichia kluyveri]|uniref:COBW domain-containing protein 1 n=1 Tax=Pichia kluyveri TaxID=36015 RepID=A0AAV5QZY8_PICKL|nr:hypothetical protein DAPK24_013810 [Pichia kluyveri]